MSELASKEIDPSASCLLSTESLKRSRACGTDDAEDAGLLGRKRAFATTLEQPKEEPGLDWTRSFLGDDMDAIQANTNDVDDDDDALMLDCSISSEITNATLEVQESSRNSGEICFGTIFDAKAAFINGNQFNESHDAAFSTDPEATQRYTVSSRQECYCLQSSDGKDFAVVDSRTTTALQKLKELPSIKLEAVVVGRDFHERDQPYKKGKRILFSISINIYGSEKVAHEVGQRLSRAHTYLQHPIYLDSNVQYINPHYYVIPRKRKARTPNIPPSREREDKQAPVVDIDKVFEDVDQSRRLPSRNTDWQIRTPLLEHQKEALYFVTQREAAIIGDDFSLWKNHENTNGSHYYQHTILRSRKSIKPDSPRGGILADDMGLGKTLTMISAIAMSLDEARAFTCSQHHVNPGSGLENLRRVSSTLVIAPSAVLLDGWGDEIQKHVSPGLLKVYKYHGIGKEIDHGSMSEHDVVMTTYATIASDVTKRSSPLQQVMWFRIVLDEAHTVRHQSTQQFRAVYSLHAERRFCLTATPIQNRMEDLGSLVRFLRVDPFDNNATFRKYISEPLLTDPMAGDRNLRLLLRSVCLRRTRVLLDIPNAKDQTVNLFLSSEERSAYSQIIEDTKRGIDNCISSTSITKAYNGIFQAILRLRLLCNNGTHQLSDSSSEVQGGPANDGYAEGGKLDCTYCSWEIIVSNEQNVISPGVSPRDSLLCPACLSPYDVDKTRCQKKSRRKRPASSQRIQHINAIGSISPLAHSEDQAASMSLHPDLRKGYSSKLSALVSNIQEHMLGNKSIVFSCWKTTLDILELMLESARIRYVRIDGAIPTMERNRIIKQFQEDPDAKLLLMTTGTGAVGLNLTAATRVHLVEPQWNPAIETQAIGRALRLGQTRAVTIIRYVMEKTIEEPIQSRQVMKLQLADLTLGKKDGNEQTVLQRLKDLRSLLHKY